MAINTTTRQTTAFTSGNNFAFAFKVYEESDVKVIRITTSTGAEEVLTITTHYTVTLNDDQNANPGGTVTLVSSGNPVNLGSGFNVVITSKVQPLQQTEITNQGGFFPEVINDVLDKAAILDQQQQAILDKTIRFPLTQTVGGLEITENAATRAGKSLRFDASGNLELISLSSVLEFTQAEKDKLAAIDDSADVTDSTTVAAAQAAMLNTANTQTFQSDISIFNTNPKITLNDSNNTQYYQLANDNGTFRVWDPINNVSLLTILSSASAQSITLGGNTTVAGDITVTGTVDGVDIAARNTLFGGLTSSSGVLTNGVTATTQSSGDNSTKVATTAYVDAVTTTVDSTSVANAGAAMLTGASFTGDISITDADPKISLVDSNNNPDYSITNNNGDFLIHDDTSNATRFKINTDGHLDVSGNADFLAGIDVTGNITVTGTVDGVDIATRDTLFGGLTANSGVLSNGVTATTQGSTDNTTKVATTAYVTTAINNLINGAPAALDTLNELAAAMNDDAAFSSTVTNSLAAKMPLSGGTFTGDVTFQGDTSGKIIEFDKSEDALKFANNTKAIFGSNLEIYYEASGNHSVIKESGNGSLIIQAENFEVQDTSGNEIITGFHDGQVRLLHHGDARLETTATGIILYAGSQANGYTQTGSITSGNIGVTGNITVTGTVDGVDIAALNTTVAGITSVDATSVNNAGAVMNSDSTTASMSFVIDEDDMASNSATKIPTQQSVRAYVGSFTQAAINNLPSFVQNFSGSALSSKYVSADGIKSYVDSGSTTLTNKTIDADDNTISDLVVSNFKSGVLDTNLASVSTSDDTLASAKAIKAYVDSSTSGTSISDGDKGDISVSNSGGTWTIDADAVTYAKMQNVSATNRILGRDSSGAGVVEEITPANLRTMINVEDGADVTDATNVAAAGALMDSDFGSNGLLKRTGAGNYTVDTNTYLTSIPSSYLQNLSEDSSPQLGGDLDMNSKFISNGILGIKNTGSQSELRLFCEVSNAHYAAIQAPAHSVFSGNVTLTLPAAAGSQSLVGTTETQTLTNKTLTSAVLNTGVSGSAILDEDNMASNSATQLATQQSIKAYVDSSVASAGGGDITGVTAGNGLTGGGQSGGVTLNVVGGTGITANANDIAIDSTVATLTGSQTLTNKTIDVDSNTISNIEVDNLKSGVLDTDLASVSSSDDTLASAKAIKAYVDSSVGSAGGGDITGVTAGTGLSGGGNSGGVTLNIDSTVTTLTGSQTLTNKSLTSPVITGNLSGDAFLDEDNFTSDSATKVASQQSIKAYVGSYVTAAINNLPSFVTNFTNASNATTVSTLAIKNYVDSNSGSGISDGDKGDITVGSSGASWTIDSGVIDNANIASNAAIDGSKIAPDFGSQNITTTGTMTAASVASSANGMRKITASTSSPSGGSDGDVWIKYT